MNDEIIVLCMNNCRSWMSLSKSCCVWHVDLVELTGQVLELSRWLICSSYREMVQESLLAGFPTFLCQDDGYAHYIKKWFKNHLLLVSQHFCDCSISVAK